MKLELDSLIPSTIIFLTLVFLTESIIVACLGCLIPYAWRELKKKNEREYN